MYLELIKTISKIKEPDLMVQIIELCANNLTIGTIQEIANLENKSYNGIKKSKQYKKIRIGKQIFAVKGVKEDGFPF